MSSTALERSEVSAVSPADQEVIDRVLSNPLHFPQAFKTWLIKFLEGSDVTLTAGQVLPGPPPDAPSTTVGIIFAYVGTVAPVDYLLCDGAAVSRSTYPALYAVCGSTFGGGDGFSTFNVPDLQGRAIFMKGSHTDVDTIGKNDGYAMNSRSFNHSHFAVGGMHFYVTGSSGGTALPAIGGYGGSNDQFGGVYTSGSGPHENIAALVLNYIVKAR
jgi:microcystin-dependent protein